MSTGLVVVASTRAAAGIYEDRSGPIGVDFLRRIGLDTPEPLVVADADILATLRRILADPPTVLLTSGGTGVTDDDRTVDAVAPFLVRELPGIVQAFWSRGQESTPLAILSRAVAGVTAQGTFVMTLPGSTGGVQDGCAVLEPILPHLLLQLEGNHEH